MWLDYIPPKPPPQKVRKQFVVFPLSLKNPAGVLAPGETTTLDLNGAPEFGSSSVSIFVEDLVPNQALDFSEIKATSKPDYVPASAAAHHRGRVGAGAEVEKPGCIV